MDCHRAALSVNRSILARELNSRWDRRVGGSWRLRRAWNRQIGGERVGILCEVVILQTHIMEGLG